jgi:hypothetical protein
VATGENPCFRRGITRGTLGSITPRQAPRAPAAGLHGRLHRRQLQQSAEDRYTQDGLLRRWRAAEVALA